MKIRRARFASGNHWYLRGRWECAGVGADLISGGYAFECNDIHYLTLHNKDAVKKI